jgi:hypothetical protein
MTARGRRPTLIVVSTNGRVSETDERAASPITDIALAVGLAMFGVIGSYAASQRGSRSGALSMPGRPHSSSAEYSPCLPPASDYDSPGG